MKIIQLGSGYFGVRQLAAARAEAALRKLGLLKKIRYRKTATGRVWTDEDYDEACVRRLSGQTNGAIGKAMGRTKKSVDHAIGYGLPTQRCGGA